MDGTMVEADQSAKNKSFIAGFIVGHQSSSRLAVVEHATLRKRVDDDAIVDQSALMLLGAKFAVEHEHVVHRAAHRAEHAGIDHHVLVVFIELGGVILQARDDMTVAVEGARIGDAVATNRDPVVRTHVEVGSEFAI